METNTQNESATTATTAGKFLVEFTGRNGKLEYRASYFVSDETTQAVHLVAWASIIHRKEAAHSALVVMPAVNDESHFLAACLLAESKGSVIKKDKQDAADALPALLKANPKQLEAVRKLWGFSEIPSTDEMTLARQFASVRIAQDAANKASKAAALAALLA